MAHHALRTRHALRLALPRTASSPLRAAFTSAARRPDDDDGSGAGAAPPGKRRGFRLKGKEVRQALEWLDGAGEQYRRPAPGRPNHLKQQDGGGGAGRPRPGGGGAGGGDARAAEGGAAAERHAEAGPAAGDGAGPPSGMLAEMEGSVGGEVAAQSRPRPRGGAAGARLQGAVRAARLGPDPRPYGLNLYYRSERVLSEELREAIYAEWAERKTPLREISQRYFVCVERAAAVVRMKQIERDWLEQVSFLFSSLALRQR